MTTMMASLVRRFVKEIRRTSLSSFLPLAIAYCLD